MHARKAVAFGVSLLLHGIIALLLMGWMEAGSQRAAASGNRDGSRLRVTLQTGEHRQLSRHESGKDETEATGEHEETASAADDHSSAADERGTPVADELPLIETAFQPQANMRNTADGGAKEETGPPAQTDGGSRAPSEAGEEPFSFSSAAAVPSVPPASSVTSGADGSDAVIRELQRRVREQLIYPMQARRQGTEGTVRIKLTLDGDGQKLTHGITQSSGASVLDTAAVETLRQALPVENPRGEPVEVTIAVRYELN